MRSAPGTVNEKSLSATMSAKKMLLVSAPIQML